MLIIDYLVVDLLINLGLIDLDCCLITIIPQEISVANFIVLLEITILSSHWLPVCPRTWTELPTSVLTMRARKELHLPACLFRTLNPLAQSPPQLWPGGL